MNKKGMTLVEIIISIVLISIVLIFLFSLLITVKDINDESEVNSTYLINKSLILKNIEEDLSKAESVSLANCEGVSGKPPVSSIYSEYGGPDYFKDKDGNNLGEEFKANNCIKFNYEFTEQDPSGTPISKNSEAYLGIYYYKNKESYVISYIHEYKNVKATRELLGYESISKNVEVDSNNIIKTWRFNGASTLSGNLTAGNFYIINIPIIGTDGKDYSINISYYKP